MNHNDALQEMATERYLLDELSPELREAFEEHMFECQECAFDVRAGNVFLTEAKVQLPEITAAAAKAKAPNGVTREAKKPWWSLWTGPVFRPAFAVPPNLASCRGVRCAWEPAGPSRPLCTPTANRAEWFSLTFPSNQPIRPMQSTCMILKAGGSGPGPSPRQARTTAEREHSHCSFQVQGCSRAPTFSILQAFPPRVRGPNSAGVRSMSTSMSRS